MRVSGTREVEHLEHNLEFLANVGSISPYGLACSARCGASWLRSRAWAT